MFNTDDGPAVQAVSATILDVTYTLLCRLVGLFAGTMLCIMGVCVAMMPHLSLEADAILLQSTIGAVLFLGGLMLARSGQTQDQTPPDNSVY